MSGHIKLLGILHIAFGLVGLAGGLLVFAVLGGIGVFLSWLSNDAAVMAATPIFAVIGMIIAAIALMLSLPGLVAGIGLLNRAEWARILTIVLSGFELLHFPVGSALGAYGLWVLLSEEGQRAYRGNNM